jgi:outer membrane usher protein
MRKFLVWALIGARIFFPVSACAATSDETVLAISINGEQVSIGSVVLRERDDTYALAIEDVREWRLRLPVHTPEQYQGHAYIPLRSIPAISVHLDAKLRRLELRIPVKYLQMTRINELQPAVIVPERGSGAFLNYDVREQTFGGQPVLLNGVFDAAATLGNGILDTSYIGNAGNEVTGLRRISSSWQQDDIARHTTLRLGDAASNAGALVVGEPFFGVQFVSNFSTAPGMLRSPRPSVSGATDTPASADVYVDGRLVVREDLPGGPFQIENIPAAGDAGNVQVVIKDASGHEQVISTPYYESGTLLKSGLTTFSWGAGFEGINDGSGGKQYGAPLAEFFEQHGFNDHFTGEFDGMATRDGRALSSGGAWLIPRVGSIDLALSAASGTGVGGSRFDYEYLSRRLRFGFGVSSLQQSNTSILTPGISAPLSITRQAQLHLSYQTSARSSVSLTISDQNQNTMQDASITSNASRTLQAGYSAAMGKAHLNFTLLKSTGSIATNAFTLSVFAPLGIRQRATVTAGAQDGRDVSTIVIAADPVFNSEHDEPGYMLTLGPSDAALQLTDWTKAADFQGGFSRIDDIDASQFEVSGSIASVDHHFFTSRSILQSYGVAEVPDHPHVRVYSDGQYVGSTDKDGDVLLPNLQAYQNNVVSLESKDFPVTANVASFQKNTVPYYRSPVTVRFPVHSDGGVVVHVKLADGSYLPAGSTLSADGFSWPVLDQGSAYLEGVHPGPLTLTGEGEDTHCHASLVIPKNLSDIPDIGAVVCSASD